LNTARFHYKTPGHDGTREKPDGARACAQTAVAKAQEIAAAKEKSPTDEGIISLQRWQAQAIVKELEAQGRRLLLEEERYTAGGRITLSQSCLEQIEEIKALCDSMKLFVAFKELQAQNIQVPRD
jgi:hypothetical protein